jgi:hypothetical protein
MSRVPQSSQESVTKNNRVTGQNSERFQHVGVSNNSKTSVPSSRITVSKSEPVDIKIDKSRHQGKAPFSLLPTFEHPIAPTQQSASSQSKQSFSQQKHSEKSQSKQPLKQPQTKSQAFSHSLPKNAPQQQQQQQQTPSQLQQTQPPNQQNSQKTVQTAPIAPKKQSSFHSASPKTPQTLITSRNEQQRIYNNTTTTKQQQQQPKMSSQQRVFSNTPMNSSNHQIQTQNVIYHTPIRTSPQPPTQQSQSQSQPQTQLQPHSHSQHLQQQQQQQQALRNQSGTDTSHLSQRIMPSTLTSKNASPSFQKQQHDVDDPSRYKTTEQILQEEEAARLKHRLETQQLRERKRAFRVGGITFISFSHFLSSHSYSLFSFSFICFYLHNLFSFSLFLFCTTHSHILYRSCHIIS